MPPVYFIGTFDVHNHEMYAEYSRRGAPTLEGTGVERIAEDNEPEILEGGWRGPRTVVLRFPSKEVALQWYHSSAYQEMAKLRHASASSNIVLVDGVG